jgi:hypothetical protein
MQPVKNERGHDHEWYDPEWTVPMQAESQEEAREQEIVAVTRPQAAQQKEECRRNEERIQREAQSHPADHVGPVGDARQDERHQPDARPADLFAKQIHKRQRQEAQDGSAKLQAHEGKPCAKYIGNP